MKKLVALALGLVAAGSAPLLCAATFNGPGVVFADVAATRTGAPFPSTATVNGLAAGPISSVKVTLTNLTHPRPDDIELLLVSPWGAKLVILADAGGASVGVTGITLSFDDAAANLVADAGPMTAGSFKPTCVDAQNNIQTEFPGVTGPYDTATPRGSATLTSVFGGAHDPNGVWSLFVVDDVSSADGASFTSWTLDVTVNPTSVGTTTTLSNSPNPSLTGQSVTFTATVRKQTDSTAVTNGTVTFREGAATLAANVALNASGQAAFNTAALTEGDHTITADYNAAGSFLASTATSSQRMDNLTIRSGNTFCNTGALAFASSVLGIPNVYPSHLAVSALTGTVSKVTLTISNLTIDRPDDFQALLVAPNGVNFNVVGDAGGTAVGVANVTLTFDDSAGSVIADTVVPATGTYRPASYGLTALPAPAPAGPYNYPAPQGSATFANLFNGLNPNGTWSLFLYDDVAGGGGTVSGGWCLTFTTSNDALTTTTTTATPNPSLLGSNITFTATVRGLSDDSVVTNGTVSFREGTTVLAAAQPLNVSGQAGFTTDSLTEGRHIITADYNGLAGQFNVSLGTVTQTVDRVTVVAAGLFCNPGALTVAQTGSLIADVYPSRILVANAGASLSTLTVTLNGLTIERPDDLELLLVSPGGVNYVLLSDAGGTVTPVSNITLTFSDAAGNFIPDAGPLSAGTFRPTSVNSTAVAFPAPAPGGPYTHPSPFGAATLSSTFLGNNPNGYWNLYVRDDVAAATSTVISGGWCLSLETVPSVVCPPNVVTNSAVGPCQPTTVAFNATATGQPTPTLVYRLDASPITSPYSFPLGTNVVTCTASNSAGTNSCSFTVTVLPGSAPELNIIHGGTNIVLSWPNTYSCYTLQSSPGLAASDFWTSLAGPYSTVGANFVLTNTVAPTNRFYRLSY